MKNLEPPLLPQIIHSLHQIELNQRNQVRKHTFIAMNDEIEAPKVRISRNRERGSRRREEIRVWCFEKVTNFGFKTCLDRLRVARFRVSRRQTRKPEN